MLFRGCGVAIITPMKDDQIDYEAFGQLLDFHVKQGTDAVVVCGTTGESATMTDDEHKEVLRFAAERLADKPPQMIAGTGSNSTHETVDMSKFASSLPGVDGLLVVTPYYNKPSQAGLIAHFKAIAACTKLPIILYNVPGRTGGNMTAATTIELAKIDNIAAIKEASGNMSQISEICREAPSDFSVYSGDDALTLAMLAVGGVGVISVSGNFMPSPMSRLVHAFLEGKVIEARELHHKMERLNLTMFVETNPVPVKTAVNLMADSGKYGLPHCGDVRLPLVGLEQASLDKLRNAMLSYGLEV
jgi:4-hydroxy-tetrahydrodipicolinate synthase